MQFCKRKRASNGEVWQKKKKRKLELIIVKVHGIFENKCLYEIYYE